MLVNIAAVALNKNTALLGHLAFNSERLRLLTEQFLPLVEDFEIKFFYETKKTELPGATSMLVSMKEPFQNATNIHKIVPKDSAVVPTKNSRSIGIEEGHRNMVRYLSRESSGYQKVARHLRESAADATAFVQRSWDDHDHLRGL
jgi:hypothetical protein